MKKIYFLLTFLAVLFLAAQKIDAQVSGTVFRDLPVNGTSMNTYGVKDANEMGVEGVTVTVYPGGTTTTTASDGTYTIAATGAVRVEFSGWPTYLKESADGGGANSSVQFVTAPLTDIDFGLFDPNEFCEGDPNLISPNYIIGAANDPGHDVLPAVNMWRMSQRGPVTSPRPTVLATIDEVGATYGLAIQNSTNSVFVSAFAKRNVGYGPGGAGAIYKISTNSPNSVILVATIPNVGNTTRGTNGYLRDSDFFDSPGKESLGDLEISEDKKTLFVVNLNNKHLYSINVDPSNPTYAISDLGMIPDPGCSNADDWRPFALLVHNGILYVGGVCSAQTSNIRTDLSATVYRVDLNNATPIYTEIFRNNNLDFNRDLIKGGYTNGIWNPWRSTFVVGQLHFNNSDNTVAYPSPMLTDLEIDEDGSFILGFRDRFADQVYEGSLSPNLGDNRVYRIVSGGDINRACFSGASGATSADTGILGDWDWEGTGGCSDNKSGALVEYYINDELIHPGGAPYGHRETAQGALALMLGSNMVISTEMDPSPNEVVAGGVLYFDNSTGTSATDNSRGYTIWQGSDPANIGSQDGYNGKGNGLGDLEILCAVAPIEIGNLVWEDTDGDGVQDSGEPGISGVTVELRQGGTTIATATTDANGNYIFSNDPNGTTTASHIYGITELEEGNSYVVSIPNASGSSKQAALGEKALTATNSGEGTNSDLNDNDGALSGDNAEASVAAQDIPATGVNNHSFDFGFAPLPPCDNTPHMLCDDASNSYTITAQTGLVNIVWYNSAGDQVGTGNTLIVDSNTPGMADGSDNYYYEATDATNCPINLCCPIYFETETCCSITETHSYECNDNATLADETDDYFSLTVTGTMTGGSGNYVVKIGAYTSAVTATGVAITIDGDGQGGNPTLAADGTSTYVVRVEDSTNSNCFVEFTTDTVDECSECPAPDCLNVQVKKNN